jgi:hypothetical protein
VVYLDKSPKAIDRMTAYLGYVKPTKAELVVDEMLAIRSEIDAWREKKSQRRSQYDLQRDAVQRMGYRGG